MCFAALAGCGRIAHERLVHECDASGIIAQNTLRDGAAPEVDGGVPAADAATPDGGVERVSCGRLQPRLDDPLTGDCECLDDRFWACRTDSGVFVSWTRARASCRDAGGDLAAPAGAPDNDRLVAWASTTPVNAWIGGRDESGDEVWRWLDGTPFWRGGADGQVEGTAYTRWQAGQPDNSWEDCLYLGPSGWGTQSCEYGPQQGLICE